MEYVALTLCTQGVSRWTVAQGDEVIHYIYIVYNFVPLDNCLTAELQILLKFDTMIASDMIALVHKQKLVSIVVVPSDKTFTCFLLSKGTSMYTTSISNKISRCH